MPNRNLTQGELAEANKLLDSIRDSIQELSSGDAALFFAYRRKVAKELMYDERGKPMHRKLLKAQKMGEQKGVCFLCPKPLPTKYAVLDRLNALDGYTPNNTRLICVECDTAVQKQRNYS